MRVAGARAVRFSKLAPFADFARDSREINGPPGPSKES